MTNEKKPFTMNQLFTSNDLLTFLPGIGLIVSSLLLIGGKDKVKSLLSVVITFLF